MQSDTHDNNIRRAMRNCNVTTLRHAAVSDVLFHNLNAVILEVVIEPDMTDSVMFNLWLVDGLLQPAVEPQNLNTLRVDTGSLTEQTEDETQSNTMTKPIICSR